jgi:hypothetical protein
VNARAGFAALSDDALRERLNVLMAACLRVVRMSPEEQRTPLKEGAEPPIEGGIITAGLAEAAWEEARRRGLVPDEAIGAC